MIWGYQHFRHPPFDILTDLSSWYSFSQSIWQSFWHSDIVTCIRSGILCDILSDIWYWQFFVECLSDFLSGILPGFISDMWQIVWHAYLAFFLAFYLTCEIYINIPRHSVCNLSDVFNGIFSGSLSDISMRLFLAVWVFFHSRIKFSNVWTFKRLAFHLAFDIFSVAFFKKHAIWQLVYK